MKAKRQNRTLSVSATMLDGSGGHVTGSRTKHGMSRNCSKTRHDNDMFRLVPSHWCTRDSGKDCQPCIG